MVFIWLRRDHEAQGAAIACAMASICNDEQGSFGLMSGHDELRHDGNNLSLSPRGVQVLQRAWLTRGPLAWALLPAAWLFGALVAMRRGLYRLGALRSEMLDVPVVVVGNVIVGGAGKTPTVMAVVETLRAQGFSPGVISRGYGRAVDAVVDVLADTDVCTSGDEPLLMKLRLRSPVVVGRDRVAAARELLRLYPATDVIVSDDGLQHLRLYRDVQVIVFDQRGVGNGWAIPAGPLREPLPSRVPSKTLVLYNASKPSTPLPGTLAQRKLRGALSLFDWWQGLTASADTLSALKNRRVTAAAGMAHPERFFDMLRAAGLEIDPLPLPDHHDFSTLPWLTSTSDVLVTEKDAIKLKPERVGGTRVWVVPLDFRLGADFERSLLALLRSSSTRKFHGHPTS